MLYLAMPMGSMHGWGICSRNLARELARLGPLALVGQEFTPQLAGGVMEYLSLRDLVMDPEQAASQAGEDAVVLQTIMNDSLLPWQPAIKGGRNLGYIFSEQSIYPAQAVENAKSAFDLVVGGSSWCSRILLEQGLEKVITIVQGVDRAVFNPEANAKTLFSDRFVIFSGGKLELRKGQDLVIRALAVMQQRHDDVMLLASWHNMWQDYVKTMASSPHIKFSLGKDPQDTVLQTMAANGLDMNRCLALPPMPQAQMAQVFKNSDLGVFPNRCEGGTNLVLMEYLACGKAAVVSNSTGHHDVASEGNAIMLKKLSPMVLKKDGQIFAVWDEPDLDELVEKLEWAYQNRDRLGEIGDRAGRSMEAFTWQAAARKFHQACWGEDPG